MRAIDADKLLHEYLEQYTAHERNGNLVFSVAEIKQDFADILIEAPTIEVPRWIPVSERLPEKEELVLILCKNGARFVGYCGKQYGDFERRWRIKTALNSTKLLNLGRVTHWMPLPNAPKDGDGE